MMHGRKNIKLHKVKCSIVFFFIQGKLYTDILKDIAASALRMRTNNDELYVLCRRMAECLTSEFPSDCHQQNFKSLYYVPYKISPSVFEITLRNIYLSFRMKTLGC